MTRTGESAKRAASAGETETAGHGTVTYVIARFVTARHVFECEDLVPLEAVLSALGIEIDNGGFGIARAGAAGSVEVIETNRQVEL